MGQQPQIDSKLRQKTRWTFRQLMPKSGFNYGHQFSLLDGIDKNLVKEGLKRFTPAFKRIEVDQALSQLIQAGISRIDNIGDESQPVFWKGICDSMPWTSGLPEDAFLHLVIVLIQAHELFEDNWPRSFNRNGYCLTAKATHEFIVLLLEKYADHQDIMDLYFTPLPITDDPDKSNNSGSEESTSPPLTDEEIQEQTRWEDALFNSFHAYQQRLSFMDEGYGSDDGDDDDNDEAKQLAAEI